MKLIDFSFPYKDLELPFPGNGSDYPMYAVSWEDAQAFCQALSRKTGKTFPFPAEAEWEYATRGGKHNERTKYSGSDSIDSVVWYADNALYRTYPVGTKRFNALGIYDMSGHVWEWCQDRYGAYQMDDTNNPTGPSLGSSRVLRGGSRGYDAEVCRVSGRNGSNPVYRYFDYGFRVVYLP